MAAKLFPVFRANICFLKFNKNIIILFSCFVLIDYLQQNIYPSSI